MRAADLHRLHGKADAAWRAEVEVEAGRIIALPDPAERLRAYAELSRVLAEEGETLPADAEGRILRSLRGDGSDRGKAQAVDGWAVERRRLGLVFALRPVAVVGCAVAAPTPFVVAAWRWGWSVGDALAAFLAPGWPLAGVALAAVAAGVMARMLGRASTLEGLAWPVVGSGAAGVAGLAVVMAGS